MVGRDSVDPEPQSGAIGQLVEIAPSPHQRFPHRVVGLAHRTEHPVAVHVQFRAQRGDHAFELRFGHPRRLHGHSASGSWRTGAAPGSRSTGAMPSSLAISPQRLEVRRRLGRSLSESTTS